MLNTTEASRFRATLAGALLTAALPFVGIATARAQDTRPVAFTNARIHTISGDIIETGTLVVRDGKIEAVGEDVTVPAGARVVDATGKTLMPGLVSAWSRAGLNAPSSSMNMPSRSGRRLRGFGRSRAPRGATSSAAATKAVDSLYGRQKIFGKLLESGVTTLALTPNGFGFPGLGAVLDPSGTTRSELTLDDDAFVQIGMRRDAGAKKILKDTLAKAKKVVEEREKPKEEKKPEAKKPAAAKPEAGKKDPKAGSDKKGPAPKPGETPAPKPGETPAPKPGDKPAPKPGEKPAPKPGEKPKPQDPKKQDPKQAAAKKAPAKKAKPKDPNLEVLADLLQGKRRAFVQIDSAADMLHWLSVVDNDVKFPRVVAVTRHDSYSGTMDMAIDHLKKWECAVLLPPTLTTKPRAAYLTNPAKQLNDAGIEIGFWLGDSQSQVRGVFFQLMELVRSGLPADVALKAVTHVPAKMLGIDKRTGSLEVGKDADLLVFDGDPLSPTGQLEQVWLRGKRVEN
ncbi:MAG: amidohydrolase family protein [Planctomycetota bacterium]